MSDPQIVQGIQPGLPAASPQQPMANGSSNVFDPVAPLRLDPSVAAQPPAPWTLEQERGFWVEQEQKRRRRELAIVLNEAVKADPELVGEAQRLGLELGVDPDVAERNLDEVRRLVRVKQLEEEDLAVRSPSLALKLRDPNFARLAHDDIDNLSIWERIAGTWEATHLQVQRGKLAERMRMGLATDAEVAEATNLTQRIRGMPGVDGFATGVAQALASAHASLKEVFAGAALGGSTFAAAAAVAGQVGPQVVVPEEAVTVPAAFMTGSFIGATLARARFSYQVEAGNHYLDMLEQGFDRDAASSAAVWVGLVNAALELGGTAAIAKGAGLGVQSIRQAFGRELARETAVALQKQTKAAALKKFLVGYATGAGGEVATEVLQEISNVVGEEYVRAESGKESQFATPEGRAAVAQRLAGIARDTMYGMAVLGAPGPGFAFARDIRRVQQAERTAQVLQKAIDNANGSKVADRNPAVYEHHLASSLEGQSGEYVHIEGAKFDEVLRQSELTYEDLNKLHPKLGDEVRAAARSGGDFITKTATLLAKFRNTDLLEKLTPILRFGSDQLSLADALEKRATFQQAVGDMVAKLEPQRVEEAEWAAGRNAVAETLRLQLAGTGIARVTSTSGDTSRLYAAMVGELARAAGMTPDQFTQKFGAKVRAVDDKVATQEATAGQPQQPGPEPADGEVPSPDRSADATAAAPSRDAGATDGPAAAEQGRAGSPEPAGTDGNREPGTGGGTAADGEGRRDGELLRSGDKGFYDHKRLEILLRQKADVTTVLHEMAHWYLDILGRLAAGQDATARAQGDMQRILDWFGVSDVATWQAMSLAEQRKYHERFAYSFERYMFEGKAPSDGLRAVFGRVAAWFRKVYVQAVDAINAGYRKATGEDLPALTPEVRAVFDRMLASEEQIKIAAEIEGMTGMFESQAQAAGVSDEQWQAYTELQDEAIHDAIAKNTAENVRHLRWLESETARANARLDREEREVKKEVQKEVESELAKQPVYRAMRWLQTGEIDGQRPTPGQAHKLSSTVFGELAPAGADLKRLTGKKGILAKDGLHPDLVAPTFGFESGRDLVAALLQAKEFDAAVAAETTERMLKGHPDLADAKVRQRSISEALQNELRARVLTSELRMLERGMEPDHMMQAAAKEAARRIIARTKVGSLDPQQYAHNSARAAKRAKEALRKGDRNAAIQAQRQRLVQHELFRAAVAADDARAETIAYMERFYDGDDKIAKHRDIDFAYAGRALAAAYGFGPRIERGFAAEQVAKAMDRLRQDTANGGHPHLAANVDALVSRQATSGGTFVDLTVEELQELRGVAESLWHEAYNAHRILVEGRRAEVKEIAGALVASIEAKGPRGAPGATPPDGRGPTVAERQTIRAYNSLTLWKRMVHWVRFMDGADDGPWRKYFLDPVDKAVAVYRQERDLMVASVRNVLVPLAKDLGAAWDSPIRAHELGFVFAGKRELIGALLHSGTESNLRKLLVPYGWAENPMLTDDLLDTSRWDRFLERAFAEGLITERDVNFVQFIWDTYKRQLPAQQRAHKELYGYEFAPLELRPLRTPWGTLEGGYVPAYTDRDTAARRLSESKMGVLEGEEKAFAFSVSTGRGHTLARNPFYLQKLDLDVTKQIGHMAQQLRFAYLQPTIRDLSRIVRNQELQGALNQYDREALNGIVTPYLEHAATQATTRPSGHPGWDAAFTWVRQRQSLVALGWNLLNSLTQITGFSNSRGMVKGRFLRSGLATITRNPMAAFQFAHERSALMRERWDLSAERMRAEVGRLDRTLGDVAPDLQRSARKLRDEAQLAAFLPQRIVQGTVDVMTWHGAYQQSLAESRADGSITLAEAEAEAVRVADLTVVRTQGSNNPEHLAAVEVNTPQAKLALAFTGYSNTVMNQVMAAGPGWAPRLRAGLWVLVVPALLESTLRVLVQGAPEDDDGDGIEDELFAHYAKGLARNATALVPVAGPMLLEAIQSEGMRVQDSPGSAAIGQVVRMAFTAGQAAAGEDPSAADVRMIGIGLTLLTGFPVHPVTRGVGYAMDVESGKRQPDGALDYARGVLVGR